MKINRKIEKMFIDEQNKFSEEIDSMFYQKETNTMDFYEIEDSRELLDACVTNAYACEFYLSHAYKYLREYLRINNSLIILGALKDDPQIVTCIEMLKNLHLKTNLLKSLLINYYIYLDKSINYKPCRIPNQTLMITATYANLIKNPKTSEEMFEFSIKSLYRAELCIEALDHLISQYLEKFSTNESDFDDNDFIVEIEKTYSNFLDEYLEFKLSHLLIINI